MAFDYLLLNKDEIENTYGYSHIPLISPVEAILEICFQGQSR